MSTPPTTLRTLLRAVADAARVVGHDDLADRLVPHERHLSGGVRRVVLVGAPGEGSSTLVGAVVGTPVCPAGDVGGTTVPWTVRGGDEVRAELVEAASDGSPTSRRQVPLRSVLEHGAGHARAVEIALPRRVLAGIELVDLPGLGGAGDRDGALARREVAVADAVWWVLDAAAPVDDLARAVLDHATAQGVPVQLVLSRADLHPDAADRAEALRGGHGGVGVAAVSVVSARLALEAGRTADGGLLTDSGVPALLADLDRVAPAGHGDEVAAVAELRRVLTELTSRDREALATVQGPGAAAAAEVLEEVRDRVDRLRRRSTRWQQVLGDGMADLVADVEHDLRDRLRAVGRDAEDVVAAQDPGALWPDITTWLAQRVAEAVDTNARWATARVRWLAAEVLDVVADQVRGCDVPPVAQLRGVPVSGDRALRAGFAPPGTVAAGRLTAVQKVLVGMRGSYSGILMIGLVTSLAGLPLVNPVSAGAGLLIGGKAYRDDSAHRLGRRRAEANGVVRRHLDEVVFQVGKEVRDQLRVAQRTLRDGVAEHVDEVQRAVAAQLRLAQEVARRETAERDREARTLRARLDQLDRWTAEVQALTTRSGPTGVVRGVA